MRVEKDKQHILKIQLNDDSDDPITTGTYYVKFKRNFDDLYYTGSGYNATDADYLQLVHDQLGVWEYTIPAAGLATEGQYTAFFTNPSNPKINDSLDLEVLRTLNYWTVEGK